jgi:aspartate aminotransferase
MEALLNAGDEVIIPAPYWVSYPDLVLLANGTPVIVTADMTQHFKITPAQLAAAITPKTRLFIINSPSNPTGMAYTQAELRALGEVLLRHPHVLVVTDDIYEHILWEGQKFYNLPMVCPELIDRTIVVNGVSKVYAMTGWRIGYAAGPEALISVMEKIQSQSTSNPCSISQKAAAAALLGDQSCITPMIKSFKHRHDLVVKGLNALPGIRCLPGDGTFYAFFSVEDVMKTHNMADDYEVAEFLLRDARVALVPGSAFGLPGFLRLSFATAEKLLIEALARMKEVL